MVVPLRGGMVFAIPPGDFHTPNLTPDDETGIGKRTDAELARMIRHSVRADGRSAIPFMEFQHLSDDELLDKQPRNAVPPTPSPLSKPNASAPAALGLKGLEGVEGYCVHESVLLFPSDPRQPDAQSNHRTHHIVD